MCVRACVCVCVRACVCVCDTVPALHAHTHTRSISCLQFSNMVSKYQLICAMRHISLHGCMYMYSIELYVATVHSYCIYIE